MQSESTHLSSILGVDIGGTFTDIVYYFPPLADDSVGQELTLFIYFRKTQHPWL
jgi:hypothetical protein